MSNASTYATLLNRLDEMQSAPYYATARDTLADAERTIVSLEEQVNALKAELAAVKAEHEWRPIETVEAVVKKPWREWIIHLLDPGKNIRGLAWFDGPGSICFRVPKVLQDGIQPLPKPPVIQAPAQELTK